MLLSLPINYTSRVLRGKLIMGIGSTIAVAGIGATATATKVAVLTTGAVAATVVSSGGVIVGIEALSVAVGTFFGMLPTP